MPLIHRLPELLNPVLLPAAALPKQQLDAQNPALHAHDVGAGGVPPLQLIIMIPAIPDRPLLELADLSNRPPTPYQDNSQPSKQPPLRWTLLPFARSTLAWELLVSVLSFYYLFLVPVEFSFGTPDYQAIIDSRFIFVMDILIIVAFTFDILVQACTCYYDRGRLVDSPKAILRRYMVERLAFDVVAIAGIMLGLLVQQYWTVFPKFTFLMKLRRMNEFDRKAVQVLGSSGGLSVY
jgi:hypothetical protein